MDFLPPEYHDGNIEYKLKLFYVDNDKFNNRLTQMKYRLDEGNGDAYYHIGIMDDGSIVGINTEEYTESKKTLNELATKLNCCVQIVREKEFNDKHYGEFLVRELLNDTYIDLKIGVIGNVDSGKSSTIGLISKGVTDDGRGKARLSVFKHRHEIETGRTSSIGHEIAGFDKNGEIVNWRKNYRSWSDIVNSSMKVISFYDMAGHEKYLRTTIYGLSAMYPDYSLVLIGGNMGISQMTREHISLCLSLKIPFIIVITKVDIAPENILKENMEKISKMCKNRIKKIPYHVKTLDDVLNVIKNIKSDSIVPILQISNVTKLNYDLLLKLLNLLPVRNDFSKFESLPAKLKIDSVYSVIGHGTIVCGILTEGNIRVNDTMYLGPNEFGEYKQVKVKSIHMNYKDIKHAHTGSHIALALRNVTRKEIIKGMILLADKNSCTAVNEFWAKITILQSHSTTIRVNYEPVIHIDNIRQAVKIKEIQKFNKLDETDNTLRTGDTAKVKFEFKVRPCYVDKDSRIIFREARIKGGGYTL